MYMGKRAVTAPDNASHFVDLLCLRHLSAAGGVDGKSLPRHCFQLGTAASQPSSWPSPRDGEPSAEDRPLWDKNAQPLASTWDDSEGHFPLRGGLQNGLRLSTEPLQLVSPLCPWRSAQRAPHHWTPCMSVFISVSVS